MDQGVRWMLLGLVILSLALVAWFLLDGADGERRDAEFARGDHSFIPEDGLGIDGEVADGAPTLAGRTFAPKRAGPVRWGPVDVSVVGPSGVPLPSVLLEAVPPAPEEGETAEDPLRVTSTEDGRARFANLPWDGSWIVRPVRAARSSRFSGEVFLISMGDSRMNHSVKIETGRRSVSAPVRGPDLRLQLDLGMPMSIEVVAAESGQVFAPAPWAVQPDMRGSKDAVRLSLEPVQAAAVAPGNAVRFRTRVSEYAAFTAADDPHFTTWVSPRARSLLARVPLRREAELFVTLADGADVGSDTDWAVAYAVGGRMRGKAHAVSDAYGRVRVSGVPFLEGETVRLSGKLRNEGQLGAHGTFGAEPYEPVILQSHYQPFDKRFLKNAAWLQKASARVDVEAIKRVRRAARLAEATAAQSVVIEITSDRARELVAAGRIEEALAETLQTSDVKGSLKVVVHTSKGKPAAGAEVRLGDLRTRVNGNGVALFKDLDPGAVKVSVVGAGAAFVAQATVEPKTSNTLELTAPEGGAIDVEVVAQDGTPLPFARVILTQAGGLPYADLLTGGLADVQRVDPYVGHDGRRTFHAVGVGAVKVDAQFGTRSGSAQVNVAERGVVLARIVLARPPPSPVKHAEELDDEMDDRTVPGQSLTAGPVDLPRDG